jgi:pyrrolidone-carboxylate peptidase
MSQVFAFAFAHTNTHTILTNLEHIDHKQLLHREASINKYIEFLLQHQPTYILGLGKYTRRDQDKIRIETIFTNESLEIRIQPFLKPSTNSKYATSAGTSYCNYISYKIALLIQTKELNSQYTFLHIPKKMPLQLATIEIQQLVDQTI